MTFCPPFIKLSLHRQTYFFSDFLSLLLPVPPKNIITTTTIFSSTFFFKPLRTLSHLRCLFFLLLTDRHFLPSKKKKTKKPSTSLNQISFLFHHFYVNLPILLPSKQNTQQRYRKKNSFLPITNFGRFPF